MLVSRSKTRSTKDISRENKKSPSLFLLKYYHNLNLFTRDDAQDAVAASIAIGWLFVFASSWAPLDNRTVSINLFCQKVQLPAFPSGLCPMSWPLVL
jgi:hypothetical protein